METIKKKMNHQEQFEQYALDYVRIKSQIPISAQIEILDQRGTIPFDDMVHITIADKGHSFLSMYDFLYYQGKIQIKRVYVNNKAIEKLKPLLI